MINEVHVDSASSQSQTQDNMIDRFLRYAELTPASTSGSPH